MNREEEFRADLNFLWTAVNVRRARWELIRARVPEDTCQKALTALCEIDAVVVRWRDAA